MEFITIELRRFIQSCYVFILLKDDVASDQIQISLSDNAITIQTINESYNLHLPPKRRLRLRSISQLKVLGKWITFRVQTNPENSSYGAFTCEFISNDTIKNDCHLRKTFEEYDKLPLKNETVHLMCICCQNIVSTVIFYKILPLPSDECDPYDWFCCTSNNEFDYKHLTCPTQHDCYYGPHYYLLHKSIFTSGLKLHKDDVLCGRCLSVLGVTNSNESWKFWRHSLQFTINSQDAVKLSEATPLREITPLMDFKLVLKYYINDNKKEICFFANEQNELRYLLLKIFENNLSLLTNSLTNEQDKNCYLHETNITKVLFNCSKVNIKSMNKDNLTICQISLKCIISGIDHLASSAKRIPPMYRFIGEYCVSYVL